VPLHSAGQRWPKCVEGVICEGRESRSCAGCLFHFFLTKVTPNTMSHLLLRGAKGTYLNAAACEGPTHPNKGEPAPTFSGSTRLLLNPLSLKMANPQRDQDRRSVCGPPSKCILRGAKNMSFLVHCKTQFVFWKNCFASFPRRSVRRSSTPLRVNAARAAVVNAPVTPLLTLDDVRTYGA
jgi:hypothetical protein